MSHRCLRPNCTGIYTQLDLTEVQECGGYVVVKPYSEARCAVCGWSVENAYEEEERCEEVSAREDV